MRKPSVLFVSWTARNDRPYFDPSTRYRCYNLSYALNQQGYRSACVSQSVFQENLESLSHYDLYVFHRPLLTEELVEWLSDSDRLDRSIADFDDLIFSPAHAEATPEVAHVQEMFCIDCSIGESCYTNCPWNRMHSYPKCHGPRIFRYCGIS